MLSLRQVKKRIRSIESTKKITRAMEMISASKLSRLEDRLDTAQSYHSRLKSLLVKLLASGAGVSHPLLEKRDDAQNITLCVITSDTGLCSTYNHKIIHRAEDFLSAFARPQVRIVAVGRKGLNYFRKKGFAIAQSYVGFHSRYSASVADQITKTLTDMFLSKETAQVWVAYTQFKSTLRYEPTIEKFLNVEGGHGQDMDYLLEPSREQILAELIPRYLSQTMKRILLESFTSEHSARMIAMRTATDNAEELMDDFILLRNKARQAAITREIIEVVSTVEALKESSV